MFRHTKLLFWLILGGVCAHTSCNSINFSNLLPGSNSATNAPAIINQQPNTVTVEVFIIRFTPQQNGLVQQLWQEIDEQSLPTQLRRELHAQGFRAGVFGSLLSPTFELLINTSPETNPDVTLGDYHEFSAADATRESGATRRTRQLTPGMWAVLKPFSDQNALPELFLFRRENGMIHGETYREAVGALHVSAEANRDGSAQIQILPVIEHGDYRLQTRIVSGIVVREENRPRHSLDSLAISQRLLPGQWIIMGATTLNSPGAGKAFFARTHSIPEQRLVAIRLIRATTSADDATLP